MPDIPTITWELARERGLEAKPLYSITETAQILGFGTTRSAKNRVQAIKDAGKLEWRTVSGKENGNALFLATSIETYITTV